MGVDPAVVRARYGKKSHFEFADDKLDAEEHGDPAASTDLGGPGRATGKPAYCDN